MWYTVYMSKIGRPTKYDPKFIDSVDEYIMLHQDIERAEEGKNGGFMYSIRAKLPTIEGFASFIRVSKSTLYDWAEEYEDFSYALEELRREQKERLMNEGLSGNYNPTIAKLILSSNHGMREGKDLTSGGNSIAPDKITVEFIDASEDEDTTE
jgi:hypothetical protein